MFAKSLNNALQQARERLISEGEKIFGKQNIVPAQNGFYVRSNVNEACILLSINPAAAIAGPGGGQTYEIFSFNPKTREMEDINGSNNLERAFELLTQYQNNPYVEIPNNTDNDEDEETPDSARPPF